MMMMDDDTPALIYPPSFFLSHELQLHHILCNGVMVKSNDMHKKSQWKHYSTAIQSPSLQTSESLPTCLLGHTQCMELKEMDISG